jgi:hypothetical protein
LEPGFEHVRIHSYGYNSDWKKTQQSTLSIHDFAQALLADMFNSPHLRKTGDVSSYVPEALLRHECPNNTYRLRLCWLPTAWEV